jgi:ribokinase
MSSTEIDKQNDKNLILVVGSANQDLTSTSDVLPTLGETIMGKDFAIACGGKGANQAVAAASLGMAPVAMVTRVGDDLFGRNLLNNFRRVGVDYFGEAETVLNATPSGVASIVVDAKSGDNQIIVTPGANYKLTQEDVRQKIMDIKPSQVLVQLEILPRVAFEALKAGKDVGATTIFNTAPAPEGWSLEEPEMQFYKYVDILILNETELEKVTSNGKESGDEETLAKSLITKGVGNAVIVTLGARGAMIVEKNDQGGIETVIVDAPEDLPARKLPVKNTVGAGDSFCGALAAYRSTGLSLADAARYACGVASMTVRKDGAQTSYPLYDELPDCLKLKDRPTKRSKTSLKPIITFVTGNKKKLEEVKQILSFSDGEGAAPFELTNQKIDLPELQVSYL